MTTGKDFSKNDYQEIADAVIDQFEKTPKSE